VGDRGKHAGDHGRWLDIKLRATSRAVCDGDGGGGGDGGAERCLRSSGDIDDRAETVGGGRGMSWAIAGDRCVF